MVERGSENHHSDINGKPILVNFGKGLRSLVVIERSAIAPKQISLGRADLVREMYETGKFSLDVLTPNELRVCKERMLTLERPSAKELAHDMGISQPRISAIERSICSKALKECLISKT